MYNLANISSDNKIHGEKINEKFESKIVIHNYELISIMLTNFTQPMTARFKKTVPKKKKLNVTFNMFTSCFHEEQKTK